MAIAGVAIGASLAISGAFAASATKYAAEQNRLATEAAAKENARATVEAAKLAAEAQIESAKQDATARMKETAANERVEKEYLAQEKWFAEHEDGRATDYKTSMDEINEMDFHHAGEGGWGSGSETGYDYGDGDAISV